MGVCQLLLLPILLYHPFFASLICSRMKNGKHYEYFIYIVFILWYLLLITCSVCTRGNEKMAYDLEMVLIFLKLAVRQADRY